ncbi:SDR family oxidoreductase [Nonomuraea sp. NPDC050451]|uniref:SDR family oxidoreductase n=1 Tax=Nonomuraea sp. NPDC050451 TaxID=3364364 RepID=UPI00379D14F1
MRIIIAGGHGKIALRLEERLKSGAVGIVRNPAHVADVEAIGAEAVVCDLERATVEEVAAIAEGADAVVFAAGAGPGSGTARKDTVDRAASVLLADAAERAGVRRFIQVSSMGAGKPPRGGDEVWAAYIKAKTEAEEDLRAPSYGEDRSDEVPARIRDQRRPGRLTDEPGTGLVRLAPEVQPGAVPRDDVAAVIVALLEAPGTVRRTLELVSGDTPIKTLLGTE